MKHLFIALFPIASRADGVDSKSGLGDTLQSFFFSTKAPTSGGWIWAWARRFSGQPALTIF